MSNSTKKKDGGKTMYSPFAGLDGAGDRYKLRPTSKAAVRDICMVKAHEISLPMQTRAQYADQAGLQPDGYEEKQTDDGPRKLPVFALDDIWTGYYVHAAMAQAIFHGFPDIVQASYDEESETWHVEVLEPELFDKLDEGVVNEAFLDFSQQRGGIQSALLKNLSSLTNGLNMPQARM